MKRYARTINLKDDPAVIARYVEHHRAVWPEVERGLRDIGIERMMIWRLGRRLFMLMETVDSFDPDRDFARYTAYARAGAGSAAGRVVGGYGVGVRVRPIGVGEGRGG